MTDSSCGKGGVHSACKGRLDRATPVSTSSTAESDVFRRPDVSTALSAQGSTAASSSHQFDSFSSITNITMAGVQTGLEVAFYLYPCGLFATLLGSQSVKYYRERYGKLNRDATADEKQAEATRRFYARLIWCFQFLLSLLLVGHSESTTRRRSHWSSLN